MLHSVTKLAVAFALLATVPASARQHAPAARPAEKANKPAAPRSNAATTRSANQPRSSQATLASDPMAQGSAPYADAVRRFLSKDKPKIVGGKPAPDGAYPWQVSLGVSWITDPEYAHFCGGSVYTERWIITAAHCVRNTAPAQVVITAGTNRLIPGSTRRNINRIIVHKNYNQAKSDNDIALLELLDPLPLGEKIRTVPLLSAADEPNVLKVGTKLVVTGWGATQEGGQTVRDLRYLDNVPFVSREVCNEPLSYDGDITGNMICAGAPGIDSCQGDSGGPLTADTSTAPKLAGVVSWGEGCARPDKYGVYTRVSNYVGWINACTTNAANCNQ